MGCDIHGVWVERREYEADSANGEVWYGVAIINGERNYSVFGLMAGVRDRCAPVVQTHRGRPEGVDYEVRAHDKDSYGDCHSHNWLTLPEVETVRDAYAAYSAAEYGQIEARSFIDLLAVVMREAEAEAPNHPTRAVFCFDN